MLSRTRPDPEDTVATPEGAPPALRILDRLISLCHGTKQGEDISVLE